jgi:hypothetical protein
MLQASVPNRSSQRQIARPFSLTPRLATTIGLFPQVRHFTPLAKTVSDRYRSAVVALKRKNHHSIRVAARTSQYF